MKGRVENQVAANLLARRAFLQSNVPSCARRAFPLATPGQRQNARSNVTFQIPLVEIFIP
jgi:hypothetical protein